MSRISVKLIRASNREAIEASLEIDVHPRLLAKVEKEWGPIRRAATRRLVNQGYPAEEIPRHWHWDWAEKAKNLKLLAYRCLALECDGKIQGLMMLNLGGVFARLPPDVGKPVVYVDYVEAAPWNVKPLTDTPHFQGIGVVLMRAAVAISMEEGFHGRVGLHSLPQAEAFYKNKCGMEFCGVDADKEDLSYFEFTRESSKAFSE